MNYEQERRLEDLEKKVEYIERWKEAFVDHGNPVKANQVVAENATSEKKSFIWVARDNDGDLYAHAIKPVFENGCFESVEGSFLIYEDNFPEITSENSPQKLVLESSAISKKEAAEEGYEPTIDDCFYNREKENSEKPNNQEFDKERALELLQDIESSSTKNSNASTKAILLSCAELREMLVGE